MAVALSGLPCIAPFDAVGEPATLEQRWRTWESEFKLYVAAAGVTEGSKKRTLFLHLAGSGVKDIFKTYSNTEKGEETDFNKALECMQKHFKLKKNIPMARQTFISTEPQTGEKINNYITRLKVLVEHCEYGVERDNQVRDRVILHIKDRNLKSKLYREEPLTLQKMVEIVSTYHDKEAMILRPETSHVNSVNNFKGQYKSSSQAFKGRCWRCNEVGHMGNNCFKSRDHTCDACGKVGHFAVCCHSRPQSYGNQNRGKGRGGGNRGGGNRGGGNRGGRNQNRGGSRRGSHNRGGYNNGGTRVLNVTEDENAVSNCTSENTQTGQGDYYAFCTGNENKMTFNVESEPLEMIIDSGANCNLMPEIVFRKIQSSHDIDLEKCDRKVYTYAAEEPLEVSGKCYLNVAVPETGKANKAEFVIISKAKVTLLGKDTSGKLGVLKIGVCANVSDEKTSQNKQSKLEALKEKYSSVFTGLGKLKNYQLKLHIDENVIPVAQAVRRLPFSRRQKVIDKLKELEELDVIEKVNEPTSWVNPLVAVEKPNGDIRICLDMRQAIVREKHPVPTVEETLQDMAGAKHFARLDLNMAFHQIELHPESRAITTFAGPNGLYRYKRLLFGVNMATQKFQQIIGQIVSDCPGVCNLHDDIRIAGRSEEELYERLDRVLMKLQEHGLTLNFGKCAINVQSMTYMGYVISDQGLKVSDDKVKAVVNAPRPQNQAEMRSFLGLAQFCAKFVPNFAIISSPLWDLTCATNKWKWTDKEESAFNEVKKRLTCAPVMAFYKQDAETRIVTDAAPIGLGAILEQKQEDGHYRPVYYASRKLNKVEQRYSQFEREALGVRWACEKFYQYVYGTDFEICTDHRPLITVLGVKSKPPSARIERWLLYLQQFSYSLRHISGRSNYADVLSRLPVDESDIDSVRYTEEYAYSAVTGAVPAALTAREIEQESAKDDMLTLVRQCIVNDDWTKLQGTIYKAVKDELWVVGQLIM